MATLILGAIGASLFPAATTGLFAGFSVGAAAFGLAGAALDNFLIFPMIFPPDDVVGPRLDGLNYSSGNEGEPIWWYMGPKTRVPGFAMWISDIREVRNEESVGGISGSGGSAVTYKYFADVAFEFGRITEEGTLYTAVQAIRKVFADAKLLWDDGSETKYDDITWYYGNQTTADPFIESVLGSGRVPKFKYRVYCVIQNLQLGHFGNRIPNLQAIPQQSNDFSVQDALSYLVERAGFDPSTKLDATRVPHCFDGMAIAGPAPVANAIQMIAGTYALVAQDFDGTLTVFPRGDEDSFSVTGVVGEGSDEGLNITRSPAWQLPSRAEVRFLKYEEDAQPGSEVWVDPISTDDSSMTLSVPITMHSDYASAVAKRLLYQAKDESAKVELSLPPSYFMLAAGDVLTYTTSGGESLTIFLTDVTVGANFRVEVQGHLYNSEVYFQVGDGAEVYTGSSSYEPPELTMFFLDMNAPTDAGALEPGILFAVAPDPASATFSGAVLYASSDAGTTYSDVASISAEATHGTVDVYTNVQINPAFIDYANYLDVTVEEGTLTTSTLTEVLRGNTNIIAVKTGYSAEVGVDWEILGFVTATSLGVDSEGRNRYRLSTLIRGLRGTEQLVDSHEVAGQPFLLLSAGTIGLWKYEDEFDDADAKLKLVPEQGVVADYAPESVKLKGKCAWPYAPYSLRYQIQYNGVGNYDVMHTWVDRSRVGNDPLVLEPVPIGDEPDEWLVEVRMGGYQSNLLYSETVTEPAFNFTDAKRSAVDADNPHGWVSTDGYVIHVHKISISGGIGRRAYLEVPV